MGGERACMGGDEGVDVGERGEAREGADLEEGSCGLAGNETERALIPVPSPSRVLYRLLYN